MTRRIDITTPSGALSWARVEECGRICFAADVPKSIRVAIAKSGDRFLAFCGHSGDWEWHEFKGGQDEK
jgi:hypothetical protein